MNKLVRKIRKALGLLSYRELRTQAWIVRSNLQVHGVEYAAAHLIGRKCKNGARLLQGALKAQRPLLKVGE